MTHRLWRGMGVVYRARKRSLDRDVAIKVLPPVRVWMRSEVKLVRPTAGAVVNPQQAVFEWSNVPQASYYEIVFDRTLEGIRIGSLEPRVRVESTSLRLADDADAMRQVLRNKLDLWMVEAFDQSGELIGIAVKGDRGRPFEQPL